MTKLRLGRCILVFAILCVWQSAVAENRPEIIRLATTDWCPYLCADQPNKPGIVVEYYRHLEPQLGLAFEFHFYPWSRALKAVSTKRYHGLATAVASEAPQMLLPKQPIMNYQMCIHTEAESTWTFSNIDSLKALRLGVMADYGYGEPFDTYISNADKNRVMTLSGTDGVKRMLSLMQKKRIDGFIADKHVVNWYLRENALPEPAVKTALCLSETPFYVAFDSALSWSKALVDSLDAVLARPENQRYLFEEIVVEYQ